MRNNKPTIIDLFCGAGGLSEGFRMAGYDVCAALDNNEPALKTHKLNHPECAHILGDIKDITYEDILNAANLKREDVNGIVGGPPCFEKGVLVKTCEGYKRIEEIQTGEFVLTHGNRYKEVLEIMSKKVSNLYELKVYGTEKFKVTANHPFYAIKRVEKEIIGAEKTTYSKPQWISVEELDENWYIGTPVNVESKIPVNQFGELCGQKQFDLSHKELWWLIGKYIADGCLNVGKDGLKYEISIYCDKKESDGFENRISNLVKYSKTEHLETVEFCIINKDLGLYLQQFGLNANKKHLTKDIFNLPVILLKSFLEGYTGVGENWSQESGVPSITAVNPYIAYGLQMCIHKAYRQPCRMIRKVNLETGLGKDLIGDEKCEYEIQIMEKAFQDGHVLQEDDYIWFPIETKKKVAYEGYVYNLEVDEDNSYTVFNLACHNCQGFSSAGKRGREKDKETGDWKFIDDPRNKLYKYFVGIVRDIQPDFFVMENVVGMVTFKKSTLAKLTLEKIKSGEITEEIVEILRNDEVSEKLIKRVVEKDIDSELIEALQRGRIVQAVIEDFEVAGYIVKYQILNAADYGVPQERKRVIFMGIRKDLNTIPVFPKETHSKLPKHSDVIQWETVGNAISDLPLLGDGVGAEEMDYENPPETLYQKFMRNEISYGEYLKLSKKHKSL